MMEQTESNPPAGWYPDPGAESGLRYWDGVQWTDQTETLGGNTPGQTVQSGQRLSARRLALIAAVVVALVVGDVGLRNYEMKRLVEEAYASEGVMLAYLEDLGANFDRLPPPGRETDAQVEAFFDRAHESAYESYYELTYRYELVDSVRVAPWHRNAVEAKRAYLAHSVAWSDELDEVAGNPARLFEAPQDDINSSWQILKVALRKAVPSIDFLGVGEDVERLIREGDGPGSSTT